MDLVIVVVVLVLIVVVAGVVVVDLVVVVVVVILFVVTVEAKNFFSLNTSVKKISKLQSHVLSSVFGFWPHFFFFSLFLC